uniref:Cytochrome c oxidase assembly protein COX19 n=2 Tax=Poecilia reticulata TaxID=8081 RepID=A0A3P9QCR3_POERE
MNSIIKVWLLTPKQNVTFRDGRVAALFSSEAAASSVQIIFFSFNINANMSTAMNFGTKSFKPRAPDKGSFPLDHFGECKAFKEKFMQCLRENTFDNSKCRLQSKDYLECRMDHQLMAREPLQKLGFKDLMDPPPSQEGSKP